MMIIKSPFIDGLWQITMSWLRPCGLMRTTIIYKYWLRLSLTHTNETQTYHPLLTSSEWAPLGRLFQQTTVAKQEVQTWSLIYAYDPHFSMSYRQDFWCFFIIWGLLGLWVAKVSWVVQSPTEYQEEAWEMRLWDENNIKTHSIVSCAWWHVLALLGLRETHSSEPILGYIERLCLKVKINLVL